MKNLHTIITFTLINFIFIIGLVYFLGIVDSDTKTAGLTGKNLPANKNIPSQSSASPETGTTNTPADTSSAKNPGDNAPVNNTGPQAVGNAVFAQNTPTPVPSPLPAENPALCIITVDGQGYDVTEFRKIHGGGDVFVCGTDMSVAFHNQHTDMFLDLMVQYKI